MTYYEDAYTRSRPRAGAGRVARTATLATLSAALLAAAAVAQPPPATEYEKFGKGTAVLEGPTGVVIEILVEASNLGSDEVEVAELTLPGGLEGGTHRHGSIEILYVISGRMDHVVNGVSHVLEPGMIGIVRPEDTVAHRVLSAEPVRALVVWAPGGEAARLRSRFTVRPARE
jgi:quercetin dioxygenase-like cupin family protein